MCYAIWFEMFRNGEKCGAGVYHKRYQRKGNAIRTAMKYYDRTIVTSNRIFSETIGRVGRSCRIPIEWWSSAIFTTIPSY